MEIKITLEDYLRELNLMDMQYGQEEELYPLINMMLRENDNVKELSIRDVHNGMNREDLGDKNIKIKRDLFCGFYKGFPDIVLLSKDFNPSETKNKKEIENYNNLMYGCIEAKSIGTNLIDFPDNGEISIPEFIKKGKQVTQELLWYGKVIYTNGLIWNYLELSTDKNKIEKKRCEKGFDYEDNMNIQYKTINIGKIVLEKNASELNIKEWNRLKNNLSVIDWTSSNNFDKFL